MAKYLLFLISILCLTSCKQKKKINLAGDDPVAINEFIDYFPVLQLPFRYADTSFLKSTKEYDSLLISQKVFSEFVPDTIFNSTFTKNQKPNIYIIGKIVAPNAETYLFIKALAKEKKVVFVLGFDKEQQFITAMPVLKPDLKGSTEQSIYMDTKYSISKKIISKNADGSLSEGNDVYVLNNEVKAFVLIMTDALDDKIKEVINPIDTLPQKSKYAADYTNGKMNIVSIRDGKKTDKINFYIHFQKEDGKCTGNIKGEASFKTPNTAIYQEVGDPCQLSFTFSSTSVFIKEIEGCGSRRPLNCSLDGSFAKKKINKKLNKSK